MLNSALKFGLLSLSSLLGKKKLLYYIRVLSAVQPQKKYSLRRASAVCTHSVSSLLALGSAIESTVMRIYSIIIWNIYLN